MTSAALLSGSADSLAVLISGGLDSAILLGESLRQNSVVHPLYIQTGLFWESTELRYLERYLDALDAPGLQPLSILQQPVGDLYARHWSLTGEDVPGADTPDEAVFLPGRNVLLLSKALLWCHLHRVSAITLGTLGSNPFPDATPAFFDSFARVVSEAVAGSVKILRPFERMHKAEVMQLGRGLPLQWSFSCIRPQNGKHCGRCNKCAERKRAFKDAAMPDPTEYCQE
jgi:7-cyano-7-deazaguanine synthase